MVVQELIFWSLFFFFNFSVFFINTFLCYEHHLWNPFRNLGKNDQRAAFIDLGGDFYKLFVELSALTLLTRWFQWHGLALILICCYYGFVLVYNTYHYAFSKIYQVLPVLGNDLRLIQNAAAILWNESKIRFIFFGLGYLLMVSLLAFGLYHFLVFASFLTPGLPFYTITGVLVLTIGIGIVKTGWYARRFDNYSRFLFMFLRIGANLQSSRRLQKRKAKWSQIDSKREVKLSLSKKPNVFFLFVESYGSVLLKEEQFKDDFLSHFRQKEASLQSHGWHCLSNESESISMVGPSWLAYTSVLMGMKITNNFEYEYFLNQTAAHKLPSVSSTFKEAGYQVVNINDSRRMKGINVPFKQMEDLFGINHWILNEDVNFEGTEYGFGENSPDQYVLNFGLDHINKKVGDPFFLFYLTKNSHTPFISPKAIAEDWKSLNNGKKELVGSHFLRKPTFENYLSAIKYQWDMLEDLILKNGADDDIFVLYGDHQPHDLGKMERHGKNTLVHVISKNQSFVNGFADYGFKKDLNELDHPIKHESFSTAFMREVIKNYGAAGATMPNYNPDGLQF